MPNHAFGGQFGPENKLIEGQPDEYDVICRNASVLAFHLCPAIFAGAPFRLQTTRLDTATWRLAADQLNTLLCELLLQISRCRHSKHSTPIY